MNATQEFTKFIDEWLTSCTDAQLRGMIKESEPFPDYYSEISDRSCPHCGKSMTKGDEECAGMCSSCYEDAMKHYPIPDDCPLLKEKQL